MNIVGISDVTGNHSHSCVAVLLDGELTFALSHERITRIKNDSSFPVETLQAALDYTDLRLGEIDCFACGYPPANYYGSLMRNSMWDLPRSLWGVFRRRPLQLSRYLLPNIRKGLFDPKNTNGLFDMGIEQSKFRFIDHHLAHVSAGYFSSGFDSALAISYGGFAPHANGQNVAGAVYRCSGDDIQFLQDIPMPASGCFYSGITVALGFAYMQQEGKTTGLSVNGDPSTCYDEIKAITTNYADQRWRPYPNWIDYIMSPRAQVFLGTRSGARLCKLLDQHTPQDIAAAAQQIWQENIVAFVSDLLDTHQESNLVLSGGTFLNVRINSALAALSNVQQVYAHPHTGDGSTTIGAMIEAHRELTGKPVRTPAPDVGLGVHYTDESIENDLVRAAGFVRYKRINGDLSKYAAQCLADGKIIGWFQGREEFGPRSLGHRCILGDPRSSIIRDRITRAIKKREAFIPVAPSCLAEHGADYFIHFIATPFMTQTFKAYANIEHKIAGALHTDRSARVQSVFKDSYAPFRALIQSFYRRTGIPMVLNTSLNRHGEPIVHRPAEAINLLIHSELDELVIGSFSVQKL